jgi:hypothetical protein
MSTEPRHLRRLAPAGLLWLFLLAAPAAVAQNPDLALTPAERDSILATYDQIFPIWGRKAIERGFLLPLPVGLNINSFYMDQGVALYWERRRVASRRSTSAVISGCFPS